MKTESRLVRFVTTLSILLPFFAVRMFRREGMTWAFLFAVAFVAFGTGRVVSRLLARGQSRARKALGWTLMFGGSAASAAYALDAAGGVPFAALAERWRAPADAGPPPPAPARKLYEGPWRGASAAEHGLCTT